MSSRICSHEGPVWQVAWSHPQFGSLLASCGYDGRVCIYKETTRGHWCTIYVYDGHASSVNSIAWAPAAFGLALACGSSDGKVSVLSYCADTQQWNAIVTTDAPMGVNAVSWAPAPLTVDGTYNPSTGQGFENSFLLATAGCDGNVRIYNTVMSSEASGLHATPGTRSTLSQYLVSLDLVNTLKVSESSWVRDVSFFPTRYPMSVERDDSKSDSKAPLGTSTGLLLAACTEEGTVSIWYHSPNPTASGAPGSTQTSSKGWIAHYLPAFGHPIWRVNWSGTGRLLAVSGGDNNVTLWKEHAAGSWLQVTSVPA